MAILAVLGPEESAQLQQPGLMLGREEFSLLCLDPSPDLGTHLPTMVPRALVLDIDLPGLSALHLVASLRRTTGWEKVPLFLLSAQDRSAESRQVGATGFFRKPLDVPKFTEALGASMASKARRFRRRAVSGPCMVISAGHQLEAKLVDVSVAGLRAKLEGTLTPGALVQLRFGIALPSRSHVVRCHAKVARRIPEGYGFAFSTMAIEDRSLLHAFTQQPNA